MQQDTLARLRNSLMADPALRERLGACEERVAAAQLLCRTHHDCEPGALADALQPIIRSPLMPPPELALQEAPPPDFLPVGIILLDGELAVEWLWLGSDGLQEPFYYRSTERADLLPINALLRCATPLSALETFADAPAPAGLIFHMSRCGSTLLSQMLASSPDHVVISEAPFFDNIVQLASAGMIPEKMVHAAAGALLRYREGTGKRGFIKLDPLHSLALPMIQRVFRQIPWIFLYRAPGEVLVSQQRLPGLHVQQGFHPLNALGIHDGDQIDAQAYPAWITEHICKAALAGWGDPNGLFVNYSQLPGAVTARILPHFKVSPDTAMLAAMEITASRDAKAPDRAFSEDSADKRDAAQTSVSVPDSLNHVFAQLERAAEPGPDGAPRTASGPQSAVSVSFDW